MSWQGVYYVNAILVLLILVFSLTVFSTDPSKSGLEPYGPRDENAAAAGAKAGVPLKYAVGSLTFVVLIVACVGCSFPGGFNSYIQANCLEVLGADAATFSATLMTLLQVGYIIASLSGGYLCDIVRRPRRSPSSCSPSPSSRSSAGRSWRAARSPWRSRRSSSA